MVEQVGVEILFQRVPLFVREEILALFRALGFGLVVVAALDIGVEVAFAAILAHIFADPRGALELAHQEIDALHVAFRSEEHTSELQSLMRISYAVFCLKKKTISIPNIQSVEERATPTN